YDSFDKFLDRLNVAIAIYLKGQNLTTEVSQGTYASTGWHMRVRRDYAANDALALGEAIRTQLIQRWGRYNVSGWDDGAAPWPQWDLSIPEDQAQVATTLKTGMEAVALMKTSGDPIDLDAVYARLGIPLIKGKSALKVEGGKDA